PGDILICLSTSGTSRNVVGAARAGRARGLLTWALTGRAPNPLADACDEALAVPADDTATVQEVHLAVIHLLCDAVEEAAGADRPAGLTLPR
ncbi:SIS domain-containing protein, partial [Sphaerisporangium rufum]|uniref:SIS domain-containing protein n=1 Tax=Sphaerisporangium rufum TaxID=1381558 RepID=UPI00194DD0F8